jgi:hypothetical protein
LPFNGNLTDSCGYQHATAAIGGAVASVDRFGFANRAYSFAGSSAIGVGGDQLLQLGPGDFTISAWIRPTTSGGGGYMRIWSHAAYSAGSAGVTLYVTSTSNIGFYLLCSSVLDFRSGSSATTLAINTWYLVTLTVQHSTGIGMVYINGILDTSFTSIPQCDVTNWADAAFRIGAYTPGNDQFIGSIDDLRIYNTVLTPSQVLAVYFVDQFAGLILYLPFTANTATDVTLLHTATPINLYVTTDRYNVLNNAYHFVANSAISIPIDTLLNIGPGDFTLSAWVKINSNT